MSSQPNDFSPLPRRRPKIAPDPPPPAEPAPPPRPVFRLRTDPPAPSEPPRPDALREIFFVNWKAHHPRGVIGSEEFERAYGDYQIKQREAKRYVDRDEHPFRLATMWWKLLLAAVAIAVAVKVATRLRAPAERPAPERNAPATPR